MVVKIPSFKLVKKSFGSRLILYITIPIDASPPVSTHNNGPLRPAIAHLSSLPLHGHSILERLRNVIGAHALRARQIGDRAGDAPHANHAARRDSKRIRRPAEKRA